MSPRLILPVRVAGYCRDRNNATLGPQNLSAWESVNFWKRYPKFFEIISGIIRGKNPSSPLHVRMQALMKRYPTRLNWFCGLSSRAIFTTWLHAKYQSVILRIDQNARVERKYPVRLARRKATLRILLADDHPWVLRCIRDALEAEEGWQVCGEAANGREAVEMAVELNPDIVVLDLSMPELNGLVAAQQIRKRAPWTDVLILTLHEGEDLTRAILEAGVSACVMKTDLPRLVAEMRTLMESNDRVPNAMRQRTGTD
jgi:CheY-like chemotaxis protein